MKQYKMQYHPVCGWVHYLNRSGSVDIVVVPLTFNRARVLIGDAEKWEWEHQY